MSPTESDSNPRRITLIHKKKDSLVCMLSRGLEEVAYGCPIEDALVLKMFGDKNVYLHYSPQLKFHKRNVGKISYSLVEILSGFSKSKRKEKIPYFRPEGFVSDVVQAGDRLDYKINELLSAANDKIVYFCEAVADFGLLRKEKSKQLQDARVRYKEVGTSIYSQINELFHEERDDIPVKKHDLRAADQKLDNYFDDPRLLSVKVKSYLKVLCLGPPILAILPPNIPDFLEHEMKSSYERRFESVSDEMEKESIALSEFAFCNPKLISGLRRAFLEAKAASNIGIYSLQAAAAAYFFHSLPLYASLPFAIPTAISSLTIARNAIQSGGRDYGGILSTALNIQLNRDMENSFNKPRKKKK